MAPPVAVESLPMGSAYRQLPDGHMKGKGSKITTTIGAVVKHDNGKVWHKFKRLSIWEKATYHHLIRRELIDFAKAKGHFDHEPASRPTNPYDVTSYHPDQKTWGPTRNDFPPILFVYARPSKNKPAGEIRYMYFNRKIVLDKDHRPVRAWPELNLTLSSKVEGFRLEALQRINPHISSRDILARMPPKVIVENRGETIVRSQMKSNALSMRKRDFRGRNCMLSWTVREGTMEIKEYLDSLLGPELLAKNSTRDMRPLTHDEILHVMLLLGKGRHPERSRHKGTSGAAVGEIGSSKRKHRKRKVDEAFGSEVPAGIDVRRMDGELHDDGYDCDNSTYAENAAEPLHPNDIQDEAAALYAEYLAYGRDPYDFLDCRNHVPTTDQEMHVLAMAIQISIDDYNMLLNADLQIHAAAFHWESYNTQWLALQEALERSWVNRGWDLHTCPALLGYPRWEGSVQDWVYLYAG